MKNAAHVTSKTEGLVDVGGKFLSNYPPLFDGCSTCRKSAARFLFQDDGGCCVSPLPHPQLLTAAVATRHD